MAFANDGVGFPVAQFRVGLHDRRTLVNTDPVRDALPLRGLAAVFISLAVPDAQY